MNLRWLGQLYKAADLVLEIKAQHSYWSETNYETLIIGIYFPFISCRPWKIKDTPVIREMGGILRGVWKERKGNDGDILRKFCVFTKSLGSMSDDMVLIECYQSYNIISIKHVILS